MSERLLNYTRSNITITVDPVNNVDIGEITIDDSYRVLPMKNAISINVMRDVNKNHGLGPGEFNAGYTAKYPDYTFTLTVPANSSAPKYLRAYFVTGVPFKMEMWSETGNPNSVAKTPADRLGKRILNYCYITNFSSAYRTDPNEPPMVDVEGFAMRHDFSSSHSKNSTTVATLLSSQLEADSTSDVGGIVNRSMDDGQFGEGLIRAALASKTSINKETFTDPNNAPTKDNSVSEITKTDGTSILW